MEKQRDKAAKRLARKMASKDDLPSEGETEQPDQSKRSGEVGASSDDDSNILHSVAGGYLSPRRWEWSFGT